jgi:hypothetical protein
MKRFVVHLWSLGLVLVLLPIGAANGQATLPNENHYKVYSSSGATFVKDLTLIDQFGVVNVNYLTLDRFANPAEKRLPDGTVYPMVDDTAHQTWWRIYVPLPARTIIAIDQFGTFQLNVSNAVYLLNPALKNAQPPIGALPSRNHYLCYEVIGSLPLYKHVVLVDQFGVCTDVTVLQSKYFCNPVEKREGAIDYPIVDYAAHLNCYQVDNPNVLTHAITANDQFGTWAIQTYRNDCLCLPALKEHILGTKPSTWGQIKALYR